MIQVYYHSDCEYSEQRCSKVVVLFGEQPEEDAEYQENIKRFYHLFDKQLQNSGLSDDHRSRSIGVLEMVGLWLSQSFLFGLHLGQRFNPLLVIIERELDGLVLVDEVGHVAVDEAGHLLPEVFVDQEAFYFLRDDAHFLVVIYNINMGCSWKVTELHIEYPFEFVVPAWPMSYQ